MDRQCRICLDIDEPNTMISPCECRGSARFIHQQCLKEYLRHYPDGLCRVCRTSMISVYEYEIILQIALFTWMAYLITGASVPLHTKGLYMAMLVPLFLTRMFSYGVIVLTATISLALFVVEPSHMIHSIIFFCVIGVFMTISQYVPPQYILIAATIMLSALYACVLTIYIATTTDPFMLSYFGGFLSLLWVFFTNMRPPFHAIN